MAEIARQLESQNRITKILFFELLRLAVLCMSQPCSNASTERAFSALRRLSFVTPWARRD